VCSKEVLGKGCQHFAVLRIVVVAEGFERKRRRRREVAFGSVAPRGIYNEGSQ
jgi:hypothetical protein